MTEGVVAMRVIAMTAEGVAGTERVVALSASMFLFVIADPSLRVVIAGLTRNLNLQPQP
jgi:hypothetical protein